MPALELWHYPVLFLVALIAGTVDAIAGGGGLITVPALLNLGLPVPLVLGTNKFQSSFGSVSATRHFVQQKAVDLAECRLGIAMTLAGALLGAFAVQQIDSGLLGAMVPWMLAVILLYTIFRPAAGLKEHPPRLGRAAFFVCFGLGLGFYDGFFGPGVGSFWAIALVLLLGQNFGRATATTKVMNATSNVASLALFAAAGQVHYGAGLAMAAGQILGGRIGAGLVVTRGARFVRPIFMVMAAATLARLLWVQYR
ncbi:TSUP family transporter [Opitutus sp. ER46]|uniref:TSUP family transporter n=1 Tax=Opitutus sp. ER46 TaxID=2161864 RepID=UPI000D2F760C|nr:TSUP family transporter [Opitutus sp. ER46]PTY00522.1 hypothetical protein DB354_01395 [Opitutus sp. ER46]